jgi:hypothetical protein
MSDTANVGTAEAGNDTGAVTTTAAGAAAAVTTTATSTGQAAKTETAAKTATIADGGGADTAAAATTQQADWRDQLAGEDAEFRKQLDRFTDPKAFARSYSEAQKKIRSGEIKTKLPDNPTPEQLAQYRKDNGLPEKPETYIESLKLPNGVVPGEADKPIINGFAEYAHGKNWSPDQFNQAVSWYYDNLDAQNASRAEEDATHKRASEDALREEWGADYRRNVNAVSNLMGTMPEEVKEELLAGRTASGRMIGNHPEIVKWLAAKALEVNPAATLLPAGQSNTAGLNNRLGEIEAMMRTEPGKYWKDENIQKEYRDLISARDKMKDRAA